MYRLIAIDMDGTLLCEDKSVSERNYDAIQRAKAAGVKIVLATGRPLGGIKNYLKHLKLNGKEDYAVVYGGAVVQHTTSGDILSHDALSASDWEELYTLSQSLGVNIHALTSVGCIAPKDSKYSRHETEINKIPLIIGDPTEQKGAQILKIMMIDEPDVLSAAITKIPPEFYEQYTVVRSAPFFLEFLHRNANKGVGVQKLAEKLNIRQNEVICIGDAGNDSHMIEYAGLGVAMGNAVSDLKEIADYVTLSNEEHGVAHVIERFIFNEK